MGKLTNQGISQIGLVLIIVAIVVVAGGIWFVASNNSDNSNINQNSGTQAVINNTTGTNSASDSNSLSATVNQPGKYVDYSQATFASAQGQKRVLFFHAGWCPTCRTADSEFKRSLNQIPSDVVLLKTNYDTESALKSKYGISYQHTFVQVDEDGNALVKWNGGAVDKLIDKVI